MTVLEELRQVAAEQNQDAELPDMTACFQKSSPLSKGPACLSMKLISES